MDKLMSTGSRSSRKKYNSSHQQRDSGSESTPLLSDCSSQEHLQTRIFASRLHKHHSSSTTTSSGSCSCADTSDLDYSPAETSYRFSSTVGEISNYRSISCLLPKRLPLLVNDRIIPAVNSSLPAHFERNKCYEIHNAESPFDDVTMVTDSQKESKDYLTRLLTKSLSTEENDDSPNKSSKPQQSSLVTIFSVWNTILGSSMLTMPWGIYMAGFVPAIVLILSMSGLCLFTAYKLLQVHKYHGGDEKFEVMELSRVFLGPWAENLAKVFSLTVLMGANIAYWILMSNFLYNSVNFLYDVMTTDLPLKVIPTDYNKTDGDILCPKEDGSNKSISYENSYDNLGPIWDLYKTVPIFLAVLVFPVLNFNTTTFFTKFNSLGTVAILYLVVFVLIKSSSWGINMDKTAWEDSWILRPTFPALSGMLSLSFFIHNIIITIMANNRNQKKNGRDLTIAYILVTVTYIIVGIAFYICFPLAKRCIEDNLLNNFEKNDGVTVGARFVLFFQLFTVYPLMAYMLRIQLLSSVFKTSGHRRSYTLLINFVIVSICVLFAIFMPHVGTIVRYTGAISGLIYVFTLPTLLHLVISHRRGTMTVCQVLCHICVPMIGILNLASQFFIHAS